MDSNYSRFEKIESPFSRSENEDGAYTVDDAVKDEYEWVFTDDSVKAVEKLDGENVAVYINEDGVVQEIYTREGNKVKPFKTRNEAHISKGVIDAFERGWIEEYLESGMLHYGEVVGPQVKGNPYDLDQHMWIPFTYAEENLYYESWGDYPKDFETISGWFESNLIPLFYTRMHNIPFSTLDGSEYVEGVVFTHPDGRFAKLRRDMFDWYEGDRHGY